MSGVYDSLSSLISSIFDIFRSIFNTIFSALDSVASIATNLVRSVVDLAGGFVNFILSNIVIIGILIAAFVGYSAYMQKQGKTTSGKKRM